MNCLHPNMLSWCDSIKICLNLGFAWCMVMCLSNHQRLTSKNLALIDSWELSNFDIILKVDLHKLDFLHFGALSTFPTLQLEDWC